MSVGTVSKPLADWQNPSPSYTPVSVAVSAFAPSEYRPMTPVPQYPNPVGVRGGIQKVINKDVTIPGVKQVLDFPRQMMKF